MSGLPKLGIRLDEVADMLGSKALARELVALGWIVPVIDRHKMKLFDPADVIRAWERLKKEELPRKGSEITEPKEESSDAPPAKRLLTLDELTGPLSRETGISPFKFREMARRRQLPRVEFGRHTRRYYLSECVDAIYARPVRKAG